MHLIIGCPVKDRAWILSRWFEHTAAAVYAADEVTSYEFAFVGDPVQDRATFAVIDEFCLKYSHSRTVLELDESNEPYQRVWNLARYAHMVQLRNLLLGHVRSSVPDLYWSLDSDILIAETALTSALDALQDERSFDAVGQCCYMTPSGEWCPSNGMLNASGGLQRERGLGLVTVDVIMAAKVMTPKAYLVDYDVDRQGEDIGWSKAARAAGCHLGWDGRVRSKHVMYPADLERVDPRCGY